VRDQIVGAAPKRTIVEKLERLEKLAAG